MFKKICEHMNDKNVLILGFGREGQSTFHFLKKYTHCKNITIADKNNITNIQGVTLQTGDNYQKDLDKFDVIIKSPGIVLENPTDEILRKLTSQTEMFFSLFSNQIIGITGTKGKSTTSTLLYHILKSKYNNTLLMGNIGIPSFDMIEDVDKNTIIVYELSAHQLEYTKISPKLAVIINLHPDHLDHYGTYEKYILAKENIYRFQSEKDTLFCNLENIPSKSISNLITISSGNHEADIFINDRTIHYKGDIINVSENDTKLVGSHNIFNIAITYAICKEYNISNHEFFDALKTYKPLAHRLEYIGEKNGIKFYDDSISTICETTIQAIKSLKSVGSVIIGGMDRGIDYTPLADYLKSARIDNIILIPNTGERIYNLIADNCVYAKAICVNDLNEAVKVALKLTKPGKVCVMSPAAASYGFFKNFEERGDAFKKYIFE